jgi:hypothetical protein
MIKSDTDLGSIKDLMDFMGLKRTYVQALKLCAKKRDSEANPSPFVGTKSCKQWIMQWLQRNRDFKVQLAYPRQQQSPAAGK